MQGKPCALFVLPHVGLDVAVKVGLLGDAVGFEELADIRFDIGGDGTGAFAVLIVARARQVFDEVGLDDALLPTWHVVAEPGEADGHPTDLVAAIEVTLFRLYLWTVEVDAGGDRTAFWHVMAEDRTEAVLTEWALFAVADEILLGFLPE